jgi:hypothetical protein
MRISGGPGVDTLWAARTGPGPFHGMTVSLDGSPNDGVNGDSGNVSPDVENIDGTHLADALVGSPTPNRLDGKAGDDAISGGGGVDSLVGGLGADAIDAKDGDSDDVDCGADTDTVLADGADRLVDCETVTIDDDRDGFSRDLDCIDTNPLVHPGAVDVFDNELDEDCLGGPAINLDRDGDGLPRPADCDDGNPALHPGARDRLGNAIDEDCVDGPAPFPRLAAGVTAQWSYEPFRFTKLYVVRVIAGTRIRVRCSGSGCPRRAKPIRIQRDKRLVPILGRLRKAELRRGARVEVRITRLGFVGVMRRYSVVGMRKAPKSTDFCLPPKARRPERC